MAEKTRADLVAEVARRFGHYASGTATGGSTTTVVDTGALYAPDDYWVGHYVYIVEDAGAEGEERPVTDYDQGDATLTVGPGFSAGVGSGDSYELLAAPRAEVVAAINAGIRAAGETWLKVVEDTSTLTIADDTYEYDLPVAVVRLLAVWVRDDSEEAWVAVAGRNWSVGGTPGARVLHLDTLKGLAADDLMRLDYLARVGELTTDAGTLGVGEPAEREMVEFVCTYALFWLHDQAASGVVEGMGFRPHLTQAQYYLENAERLRARVGRFHGAGTLRGMRWGRARG